MLSRLRFCYSTDSDTVKAATKCRGLTRKMADSTILLSTKLDNISQHGYMQD